VFLLAIALSWVWVPVAIYFVTPKNFDRLLDPVIRLVRKRGGQMIAAVFFLIGEHGCRGGPIRVVGAGSHVVKYTLGVRDSAKIYYKMSIKPFKTSILGPGDVDFRKNHAENRFCCALFRFGNLTSLLFVNGFAAVRTSRRLFGLELTHLKLFVKP
jgi:hypothetical protein